MSQTSTIFRPSKVQNLVLYWPQYKAQLMLQSHTEANTCDIQYKHVNKYKSCRQTCHFGSNKRTKLKKILLQKLILNKYILKGYRTNLDKRLIIKL